MPVEDVTLFSSSSAIVYLGSGEIMLVLILQVTKYTPFLVVNKLIVLYKLISDIFKEMS